MAPIIKGSRPERPAPAPGDETGVRAHAIVDDAELQAAALLDDARNDVMELVRQGAEAGQAEGFQEAQHMREEIQGLEQRMIDEVQGEIVRTAIKVAEEILVAELKTREEAIVDVAQAALGNVSGAREVYLRVNPASAQTLRKHKARLVDALAMVKDVEVREDRKVKPGGVLIQTESGVVDATLETQLAELARILGA